MLIAADTRFLSSVEMHGLYSFSNIVLTKLANQQPDHRFIFFVDKAPAGFLQLPENVSIITITPGPKNFFSHQWWYNVKLGLALRKYKPDIFIGTYGLCSITTSVPQLMIVHDLSFLHKQSTHPKHSFLFYKKSTKNCLLKSAAVATLSQTVREEIEIAYHLPSNKIRVCGCAGNTNNKKPTHHEKDATKEAFANGCEYFIYEITDNTASQFIHVLKAFSIFKKWQRSNMKLLVTGYSFSMIKKELQKLETYKYKSEVLLYEQLPEAKSAQITASAYAAVYPVLYEGFSQTMVSLMNLSVPSIVYDIPVLREICGDAALYAPASDAHLLAEQMKSIYKDEKLRSQLIKQGMAKGSEYSWEKTTNTIWEMILTIAKQQDK